MLKIFLYLLLFAINLNPLDLLQLPREFYEELSQAKSAHNSLEQLALKVIVNKSSINPYSTVDSLKSLNSKISLYNFIKHQDENKITGFKHLLSPHELKPFVDQLGIKFLKKLDEAILYNRKLIYRRKDEVCVYDFETKDHQLLIQSKNIKKITKFNDAFFIRYEKYHNNKKEISADIFDISEKKVIKHIDFPSKEKFHIQLHAIQPWICYAYKKKNGLACFLFYDYVENKILEHYKSNFEYDKLVSLSTPNKKWILRFMDSNISDRFFADHPFFALMAEKQVFFYEFIHFSSNKQEHLIKCLTLFDKSDEIPDKALENEREQFLYILKDKIKEQGKFDIETHLPHTLINSFAKTKNFSPWQKSVGLIQFKKLTKPTIYDIHNDTMDID